MSLSLFAVEIDGKNSNEVSETMYRDNGFVFRPFHTDQRSELIERLMRIGVRLRTTLGGGLEAS